MRGVSRVRFASLFIGLAVGVVACAGVGIGEAIAPAKGATASGDRRSGGDDVVHEDEPDCFSIPSYRFLYSFKTIPLALELVKHNECHGSYRAFEVHPHFPVNSVSAVDAAEAAPPRPHYPKRKC